MFLFKARPSSFLEGERLNLRSLQKKDFHVIYSWLEDRELMQLAFGVSSPQFNLFDVVPAYKREIAENMSSFLAIESKNDRVIGFCSHTSLNFDQRARIGILIGDRLFWNRGFGREAVMLLLRYLFLEKRIRIIELDTAISNFRAQKCFESCGFNVIHKDWCEANERLWYELERDHYLAQSNAD